MRQPTIQIYMNIQSRVKRIVAMSVTSLVRIIMEMILPLIDEVWNGFRTQKKHRM